VSLTVSNLESPGDPHFDGDAHDPAEQTAEVQGRSPSKLAWARFRKDRLSMVALVITGIFLVIAVSTPVLVGLGVLQPNAFDQSKVDLVTGGLPYGFGGGMSWDNPLGVEPRTGRDVLSRLMLGLTISLSIALTGAIITVVVGTVLGIIAGFTGGAVDSIIGRIIDLTLSFPSTLMLLALSGVVVARMEDIGVPRGPNASVINGAYVVLVLALFGWPPVARLIRGQVLSIREREYIEAAKLMGASRPRIYFREILPNLWAPLLVYFTLLMPAYVSAEAALQFLGVGIQNPTPTLGNVLTGALPYAQTDRVFFFVPAIVIAAIVISFNLLGDGARDALDPKSGR
jgi:peptide/nickel transport system permease protein